MHKRMGTIMMLAALAVLLLFSAGEAAGFDYEIQVETMVFKWKVERKALRIELSAKTRGWLGIGFNPSEEMKDANIIIGYVKLGQPTIRDDYGISRNIHDKDLRRGGKDNVTLISGSEENGRTTLTFSIPLKSGDPRDNPIYVDGDTVVLLAYHKNRDSFRSQHRFRTRLTVNLGTGKYKVDKHMPH